MDNSSLQRPKQNQEVAYVLSNSNNLSTSIYLAQSGSSEAMVVPYVNKEVMKST